MSQIKEKRLAEARQRLEKKIRERIRRRKERSKEQQQPRYDEVYAEGTWMLMDANEKSVKEIPNDGITTNKENG